jgi:hypothetical protein
MYKGEANSARLIKKLNPILARRIFFVELKAELSVPGAGELMLYRDSIRALVLLE